MIGTKHIYLTLPYLTLQYLVLSVSEGSICFQRRCLLRDRRTRRCGSKLQANWVPSVDVAIPLRLFLLSYCTHRKALQVLGSNQLLLWLHQRYLF